MASWSLNEFLNLFLTLFAINFAPAISSPIFKNFIQLEASDDGSTLDFLSGIKKFYLPVNTNNSNCNIVVEHFLPSIATETIDSWALKMADSWGKIPDGFFYGNIHIVGMYEECLQIQGSVTPLRDDSKINFQGKYCKIFYESDRENKVGSGPDRKSKVESGPDRKNKVGSGPGIAVLFTPLPFYYATCIPSVCTDEDLMVSLTQTFSEIDRKVVGLDCHEEGRSNHAKFDEFDAFVCSFLGLLVLLVIIGTIVDENNLERYGTTPVKKQILQKLTCFSLTKSFKSTFRYVDNSKESIGCIHGMRVITLLWIMTCHQGESGFKYIVNYVSLYQQQRDGVIFQLILNGYQPVETFFCLSGIVLSFRLFPTILRGKDFSAKTFLKGFAISLFRRVMRLLPSIFAVATFSATLLRFLGFGPRSAVLDEYQESCRKYWWKDPLFVDNLVHDDARLVTQSDCLSHCWYTSVEMQLFLIVPIVFLPRIYNKLSGYMWLFFLTVMSQAIPVIVMTINEFPPVSFPYISVLENYEFYTKYYEVPWCRATPWFIGIWTGIILVKYPHKLKKIPKILVAIGYVVFLTIGLVIIFGLYPYNRVDKILRPKELSMWLGTLYGISSKTVWAMMVSWVIMTCYLKKARMTNAFLSWLGWQPLSRLSFCMYLVSPVVQIWWSSTLYIPVYESVYRKILEETGAFFISFVVGFVLSALVEQPFMRLTDSFASSRGLSTHKQLSRQKK